MKNFKEIAEKCLTGELSGTFVLRNGKEINSEGLIRNNSIYHPYTFFDKPFTYTDSGSIYNGITSSHECDIINFIPDKMTQKKIEIDIPKGKMPVMEQTENGVVITWKEKEITYADVISKLVLNQNAIYEFWSDKIHVGESSKFYKKVEVLRKLTNIRNYFGKPENMLEGWCIAYSKRYNTFTANYINNADEWFRGVIFKEGEHAEQAIKMLGDELKYLFEPW